MLLTVLLNFISNLCTKLSEFWQELASSNYQQNDYQITSVKLRQVFGRRGQRAPSYKGKEQVEPPSRRTVSLLPAPIAGLQKQRMDTQQVRFFNLLIQIEGNQCSGCLQINSPKNRSRAAVLVYRGRAIGAVWGQRNLPQSFGKDALKNTLADLASPDNQLLAYQLPETIVLAAASLFIGDRLPSDESLSARENCHNAIASLRSSELPGCVVIDQGPENDVCLIYVGEGKILGLHSIQHGWLAKESMSSFFEALSNASAQVQASILLVRSPQEAYKLGMSLTGIGDKEKAKQQKQEIYEAMRNTGVRKKHRRTGTILTLDPRQLHRVQPAHEEVVNFAKPRQYSGFHASTSVTPMRHAHMISP